MQKYGQKIKVNRQQGNTNVSMLGVSQSLFC